jgi:pimeloyl-ACP methyl ester carboxylesterase
MVASAAARAERSDAEPSAKVAGTGRGTFGTRTVGAVRRHYRRNILRTPEIRMMAGTLMVDGRRFRYAVSDNENAHGPEGPGSDPIWAVNLHGYFAGGSMYWRESARLAHAMGWRVINPSLPGFGGSDPLAWNQVSMEALAEHVDQLLDHLGGGPAVLLGHSMGGAVAVQYADDHPQRTLGIIYRDGVGTPAWRDRRGVLATVLGVIVPDMALMADMMAAMLADTPDLFIGRMSSTMRSVIPDVRRNVRSIARTMPVGAMLMATDLRPEVRRLADQAMPILAEWGCFDRVSTGATAAEFADCARTAVQWVPGGHSWMLARPQGQADVLTLVPSGRRFVQDVEDRWHRLAGRDRSLRALS